MKSRNVFLSIILALLALSASGQPLPRTFVSLAGEDVNSCSKEAPCRSFTAAIDAVINGGEVIALDSGDYFPFTINNRSVSVLAVPGVHASIASTSGAAINVIGGSSQTVFLRGLSLTGLGALHGVAAYFSGALWVDDMLFHGFANNGIILSSSGRLFVNNCGFSGNGNFGVITNAIPGPVHATIGRCWFDRNGTAPSGGGVMAAQGSRVVVIESDAAHNASGYVIQGPDSQMLLHRVTASNGGIGLLAENGNDDVLLRVSESVITNNAKSIQSPNGTLIYTRGDNTIQGNATSELFDGSWSVD